MLPYQKRINCMGIVPKLGISIPGMVKYRAEKVELIF
jgi:hypothetical protein